MDDEKVVPMFEVTQQINSGAVELLEHILERLKAGEVVSFCGVLKLKAGDFGTFISDDVLLNVVEYLGYLKVLEMRLTNRIQLEP